MKLTKPIPSLSARTTSITTSSTTASGMGSPALRPARKPGQLYWPVRALTAPLRHSWLDIDFVDLDNVPLTGPVVLAPNHISFLDSLVLMYGLPRKVLFLGKAEYTQSLKTRFFPAAGMIPVNRGGKGVVGSLALATDILTAGGAIGIFPEGTRSRDSMVHKGHTGAAHLAMRSNAALIPVGISGTDLVQPPDASFPKRGAKITIRFGSPLDIASVGRGSKARTAVTHELMKSIAVLAHRPYVNTLLAPGGAERPQPRTVDAMHATKRSKEGLAVA